MESKGRRVFDRGSFKTLGIQSYCQRMMAFWVSNHFPKRMSYLAWTKAFSKAIGSFDRNDGSMGRTVYTYYETPHRNQPFIVDIQLSHESVMGGLKWIGMNWDLKIWHPQKCRSKKFWASWLMIASSERAACLWLPSDQEITVILISIVEVGQFESEILPEIFCQLTTEINLFFSTKKHVSLGGGIFLASFSWGEEVDFLEVTPWKNLHLLYV